MKSCFFTAILLICFNLLLANNVRVTNVSLSNQHLINKTYRVNFNIAWDNSWRTSTNESNWDAVWIFIKYRPIYSTVWYHATLNRTNQVFDDQTVMEVKSSRKGAIIQRGVDGVGNLSYENAFLIWNYGTEIGDKDKIEIAVFAVEMVYVPEGIFSLGDGGDGSSNCFHQGQTGSQNIQTVPYTISSESTIIKLGGVNAINLCAGQGFGEDFNDSTGQVLPASYPKGYAGFYCMKYECSMGQYTAFLNKITPLQASAHIIRTIATGDFGFTIFKAVNRSEYQTETPERACNYVSFTDAAAYAQWAGMRMMTELEYEKACRGDLTPVLGEYAWGSPNLCVNGIVNSLTIPENDGLENELIPQANLCPVDSNLNPGNFVHLLTWQKPLRCGIVAASAPVKSRIKTGATYFGILDMTGNVAEWCVGVGDNEQRLFTNTEGTGALSPDGLPDFNPNNAAVKGFTRITSLIELIPGSVSSRYNHSVMQNANERNKLYGFRCVLNAD